jgi:RHS repeat-associated protein
MYYFINDHLGTPQKIVNSSAQVVWAAAYLPFGKAQVTTETVANNLRFPGQYSDAGSGLHYNWNRYYDPETGRYITADPIGLAGGINLYAYVMGNPVNKTDKSGLWVAGVGLGAGGGTVLHPSFEDTIFVGGTVLRYFGTTDKDRCRIKKGIAFSYDRTSEDLNPFNRSSNDGSFYGIAGTPIGMFFTIAPWSNVENINGSSEIYGINAVLFSLEITTSGFLNISIGSHGFGFGVYHLHSNATSFTTFSCECE